MATGTVPIIELEPAWPILCGIIKFVPNGLFVNDISVCNGRCDREFYCLHAWTYRKKVVVKRLEVAHEYMELSGYIIVVQVLIEFCVCVFGVWVFLAAFFLVDCF